MRPSEPPPVLQCPTCGQTLVATGPPEGKAESYPMRCHRCGKTYRVRPRAGGVTRPPRRPIGGLALFCRSQLLRMVFGVYRLGQGLGTVGLFVCGGFVPVARGWLDDSITSWRQVVAALGGVAIRHGRVDPDADFGPILKRGDAPRLFDLLAEVALRLEVRPPEQVRLAFLPCCGVVAWGQSSALLLGLPLLPVLEIGELRAILVHELAHLARGDATWSARLVRSVEVLGRALDDPGSTTWGPLRWWALACRRVALTLLGPIAEGQETRADRLSASIAGGGDAASALVKVALVQPLFRELLEVFDIEDPAAPNLYATFRRFWGHLPKPLIDSMRMGLLTTTEGVDQSPHPPLADRVAHLLGYPNRPPIPAGRDPAATLLGDVEWIEQMMHDRLYNLHPIEPTVFHNTGT